MEESKNRWKQKAKRKGVENRALKKQVKKLSEQLNRAKGELQKYKKPASDVQEVPEKPAKEEKKSLKDTGSS